MAGGDYDTKITIGMESDLSGGIQTEKQLDAIRKKAKLMAKETEASANKSRNAIGSLLQGVGLLRKALTVFGVAGLFTTLIAQVKKIRDSFKAAQKTAEDFAKIQRQLAEDKGLQRLAADYARLKDAVAAATAEQQHSLDMIDEDVKNRRRLEAAQRTAAKEAELSALDPSDPAYAQKKAAIEARYERESAAAAASDVREDIALQQQRLETQAGLKDQKASAQDAQSALIRRKIARAQREKSAADIAAVSLNENDKTDTLSAIGSTLDQLFARDWGRLTKAKTKEGDAERKAAAEKSAAAELKIEDLQEQLRESEELAAAIRKEAERLRERAAKAGDALPAADIEGETSIAAARRTQTAAGHALEKKEAQIAADESTIAQGPERIAALKRQIAAVEAQKSSAISADAKEQRDAVLAQQALDSFNAAGHRRNGTGVQARRGELEADVARETQEATQSRAQLQSTLATLAATLKGLNSDLKKVEREVDAAVKRQNATNDEAPEG